MSELSNSATPTPTDAAAASRAALVARRRLADAAWPVFLLLGLSAGALLVPIVLMPASKVVATLCATGWIAVMGVVLIVLRGPATRLTRRLAGGAVARGASTAPAASRSGRRTLLILLIAASAGGLGVMAHALAEVLHTSSSGLGMCVGLLSGCVLKAVRLKYWEFPTAFVIEGAVTVAAVAAWIVIARSDHFAAWFYPWILGCACLVLTTYGVTAGLRWRAAQHRRDDAAPATASS
jgi:hypothetical protein